MTPTSSLKRESQWLPSYKAQHQTSTQAQSQQEATGGQKACCCKHTSSKRMRSGNKEAVRKEKDSNIWNGKCKIGQVKQRRAMHCLIQLAQKHHHKGFHIHSASLDCSSYPQSSLLKWHHEARWLNEALLSSPPRVTLGSALPSLPRRVSPSPPSRSAERARHSVPVEGRQVGEPGAARGPQKMKARPKAPTSPPVPTPPGHTACSLQ